ncbi:fructokinase [Pedobacter psychrotolerans]|uniref:Fructokinase n=1 Tax=Pedobacter psychrotolerans TaxID=1843235 RepID=A0A4V2RZ44_9SPHI|nr:carbohydrate kinase [Pedobacter psychrotolerans]TCO23786.1 fructokinase [Pedobacter psychrotolerans]GGE62596.1 fructokinase [Pedobacter psychrotolerans]
MKKTVISIGEILWDVFPEGKKAGGSSMNVALNLHKQGINSKFISAVGDDESGKELIEFLKAQNFESDLIQINDLPTSTVEVKLDESHQATYTIVEPVAWDAINLNDHALEAVKQGDAFVYCSLTCRNEKSKDTILALLKQAKLKIFDINLRPPFYTIETLKTLLGEANILKVNEHELVYLKDELALTGNTDEQLLKQLSLNFNIEIICLTVGEKGAYVLQDGHLYHHKGYQVEVADTVGAGDSFLATFISSYLNGYPINTVLDRACKVGAFVASQHGANPDYGDEVFS